MNTAPEGSSDESLHSEEESVKVYPISSKKRPAEDFEESGSLPDKPPPAKKKPPAKSKLSKYTFRIL